MKISNNYVSFGISVPPKMKYNIFKETKKFFSRREANKLLELIQNASDNYILDGFNMSMPNKRERNIFCDIFIKSKQKGRKSCLIHAFLEKLKNGQMQNKLLADAINGI